MVDRTKTQTESSAGSQPSAHQGLGFPVIGLGSSAGEREAFEQFFRNIPPDSGMALILVSHLDPSRVSILTDILQHTTAMPVFEAQAQMSVRPDHVVVRQTENSQLILLAMENSE